jgi:predicted metal-binding membrane protein
MMFAMMTPSAAPMVLTYAKINRQQEDKLKPVWGTAVFYAGYLPLPLPHTAGLFHDRMARRQMGRSGHGYASWGFLCGLLLADYGAAFCSWRYEPLR